MSWTQTDTWLWSQWLLSFDGRNNKSVRHRGLHDVCLHSASDFNPVDFMIRIRSQSPSHPHRPNHSSRVAYITYFIFWNFVRILPYTWKVHCRFYHHRHSTICRAESADIGIPLNSLASKTRTVARIWMLYSLMVKLLYSYTLFLVRVFYITYAQWRIQGRGGRGDRPP